MNKAYPDGTSADTVIMDGWTRGFEIEQTIRELRELGHLHTVTQVRAAWDKLDDNFFRSLP